MYTLRLKPLVAAGKMLLRLLNYTIKPATAIQVIRFSTQKLCSTKNKMLILVADLIQPSQHKLQPLKEAAPANSSFCSPSHTWII